MPSDGHMTRRGIFITLIVAVIIFALLVTFGEAWYISYLQSNMKPEP